MPQHRLKTPKKCGLTVYSISHTHFIFAHIQVRGQGDGEKASVSAKQSKSMFFSGKNTAVY
jgi:hypothetical protein